MSSVNIKVTGSEISESKQIITSKGVEHGILEAKVKDETGGMMLLILWDEKKFLLKRREVFCNGEWFCDIF